MSKRPKGIKTNGKGQRTTAHLNLTRTMADVWAGTPLPSRQEIYSIRRGIIQAGYADGTKVTEIARQCGSTPGAVRAIAHKMGLRHRRHIDMRVPPEKQADYRMIVAMSGCNAAYAAQILGLEAAGL